MYDVTGLKRYITNGYYQYYIPDHHLANKSGLVYEHMMVAEDMLGRKLKEGEVIHHKDRNRLNNSFDNLMVFKTGGDHTAFHQGRDVELDGDVYIAIGKYDYKNGAAKDACPVCGKEKYATAKLCLECARKEQAKNIPSKEELREHLRDKSFLAIGREYDVSDNAVRKWCKKYGLPSKRTDVIKFREEEFGIIKPVKEKQKASEPKPVEMCDDDWNVIVTFVSMGSAARYAIDNLGAKGGECGIRNHISQVCKDMRKTAYGHKWRYTSKE